jgi:hypothetical protein
MTFHVISHHCETITLNKVLGFHSGGQTDDWYSKVCSKNRNERPKKRLTGCDVITYTRTAFMIFSTTPFVISPFHQNLAPMRAITIFTITLSWTLDRSTPSLSLSSFGAPICSKNTLSLSMNYAAFASWLPSSTPNTMSAALAKTTVRVLNLTSRRAGL